MTLSASTVEKPGASQTTYSQLRVERAIDALINSLPNPAHLTADQRRGIIARYTAVLEGNFIYWMTGAYLGARTEEAREIITHNLVEEVRDAHPAMLRRFAIAANAVPKDSDTLAVYRELTDVRLFVGRLSGPPALVMMAFFEGFIQKFMDFLAKLAADQGSTEMEYTDVHGVCDIEHTAGLFRALEAELAAHPQPEETNLFEGMDILTDLIQTIVPPAQKKQSPVLPVAASMTA